MAILTRFIIILIFLGTLSYALALDTQTIGGDFTLTTQLNESYSLSDSKGKVVLLFFGFTHCPDVCPMTLGTIKTVLSQLGDEASQVQPLLITVDPKRDTPEILKNYLVYFGPNFIGLTGTIEEIDSVVKQYQGFYSYEGDTSRNAYNVDHTSNLYIITPSGEVANIVPFGLPPEAITKNVKKVLLDQQ